MPKIRVEVEVPDSKYCGICEYRRYIASDFAVCVLFGNATTLRKQGGLPERCDECKQAEVEE